MKMRVSDLIDQLKRYNSDLRIYMSADPEGNSFCRLEDNCISIGYVETLNYFVDDIKHHKELTPELQEQGYCQEDLAGEDDVEVLVIYPG